MIANETEYKETLDYITQAGKKLAKVVVGQELAIDTVTVFAQSEDEYTFLDQLLRRYGPVSHYTHGTTLYVETKRTVAEEAITLLGVRQPDPTRPQVGYTDYPADDLETMRQSLAGNQFVTAMTSGNGTQLLELRHPDFDVLGYIAERE